MQRNVRVASDELPDLQWVGSELDNISGRLHSESLWLLLTDLREQEWESQLDWKEEGRKTGTVYRAPSKRGWRSMARALPAPEAPRSLTPS